MRAVMLTLTVNDLITLLLNGQVTSMTIIDPSTGEMYVGPVDLVAVDPNLEKRLVTNRPISATGQNLFVLEDHLLEG